MMKVVDASAVVAILFDEPTHEATRERLKGSSLMAPILLPFEVASACLKKMRETPSEEPALIDAFHTLASWNIEYLEVDLAGAIAVANQAGISLYDATYLTLALEFGAELVTLDKELDRAAALP